MEVLLGALVAIVSAALGAYVSDRLSRDTNTRSMELQRLALLADLKIEAYAEFREAAMRFVHDRYHPELRGPRLQEAYSAYTRILLCDSSDALTMAAEIFMAMQRESSALAEVTIDGEKPDAEGRIPVYRTIRPDEDEEAFTTDLLKRDAQLIAEVRREFGLRQVRAVPPDVAPPELPEVRGPRSPTEVRIRPLRSPR